MAFFLCIHLDKSVFLDLVSAIYVFWFDLDLSSVFLVDEKILRVTLNTHKCVFPSVLLYE